MTSSLNAEVSKNMKVGYAAVVVLYRKDTHPIVITKEGAEYEDEIVK